MPEAHQPGDLGGILGVGLERAIVLQLLGPIGVGREHIDHGVAPVGEEAGEGEAVVAGELEAHQHLAREQLGKQRAEVGVGGLEAGPAHQHLEGLGAAAVGALGHEHVELLGGVDADVDGELPGVGVLLIGGHGRLRGGR